MTIPLDGKWALPNPEMVAATARLEKEHSVLPAVDLKDAYSDVLGEIGDHNVVIACLADDSETEDDEKTRDIRLGDVAVSENTKSLPAVIQYDFRKSLQRGGFVHIGAEEFNLPAKAKDRLFKFSIDLVDKKKSCKACCGPEDIKLVKRTHRKDINARVHYGIIGSADNVMRNAVLRDKWVRKKDIIF